MDDALMIRYLLGLDSKEFKQLRGMILQRGS